MSAIMILRQSEYNLWTKMRKGRADCDEPQRDRSDQIEVEPKDDAIEGAMNNAVQCTKYNKDPRGAQIEDIHLLGDKEVEGKGVENDRNLEQVLEIVRWVRYAWR